TADISVWVSHTPPLPSALSADSVELDFPEGYEHVVAYETAAMMLAKGGLQSDESNFLRNLAYDLRREMMSDLARVSIDPTVMRYSDTRAEWGS
ncbi:MAG: hypothetical protein ACTS5I_08995, partial [Rhodanobacter sp.]